MEKLKGDIEELKKKKEVNIDPLKVMKRENFDEPTH